MDKSSLLDNERSKSELNSSALKAQFTLQQAYMEMRISKKSFVDGPSFVERGADVSTKNIAQSMSTQKLPSRTSRIYPSYISDANKLEETSKIENIFEHMISVAELEDLYKTSLVNGLTATEASRRLNQFGRNSISPKKQTYWIFVRQVFNYFTIALMIPITLSFTGFALDQNEHYSFLIETIGLFIILFTTHLITFMNFRKKQIIFSEFNQILNHDNTIVIRDGVRSVINSALLVPGDLIEISANVKVAADCRIIQSQELRVDNSLFTGECDPVLLDPEVSKSDVFEARNIAFSGAGCVYGTGSGIIIRTGDNTLLGKLAQRNDIQVKGVLSKEIDKVVLFNSVITIVFILIVIYGWYSSPEDDDDITFLINTMILIILSVLPISLMLIVSISKLSIIDILSSQDIILKDVDLIESLTTLNIVMIGKEALLDRQKLLGVVVDGELHSLDYLSDQIKEALYYCSHQNKNSIEQLIQSSIKFQAYDPPSQYKQFTQIEKYQHVIVNEKAYIMGTPEFIFEICKKEQKILDYQQLGHTVISIAFKSSSSVNNSMSIEQDLVNYHLLGSLVIKNKLSQECRLQIQKMHLSDIKIIYVSGDHPETSLALTKQVGIVSEPCEIVTGDYIESQSNKFDENIPQDDHGSISTRLCHEQNVIYARINPAQKLMVIQAYQKSGYRVGILGVKTTDSPSLSKADVGFAINKSCDLPKQSADVMLMGYGNPVDQIHNSIIQGRRMTTNLIKQIQFCICSKFGQFVPVLLMLFIGIPLPLTNWGIIYISIVLDILVVALIYEEESVDLTVPTEIKLYRSWVHFVENILSFTIFSASSGMICYIFGMYYYGFSPAAIDDLIYLDAYSSRIPNTHDFYPYDPNNQYLGNLNLMDPKTFENPFIEHQFYKHFNSRYVDLRNCIVQKGEDDKYHVNFPMMDNLCEQDCYTMRSVYFGQTAFIYGYLIWGWIQIYLQRASYLSSKFQRSNKFLNKAYALSFVLALVLYIPQAIEPVTMTMMGIPSIVFNFLNMMRYEFQNWLRIRKLNLYKTDPSL